MKFSSLAVLYLPYSFLAVNSQGYTGAYNEVASDNWCGSSVHKGRWLSSCYLYEIDLYPQTKDYTKSNCAKECNKYSWCAAYTEVVQKYYCIMVSTVAIDANNKNNVCKTNGLKVNTNGVGPPTKASDIGPNIQYKNANCMRRNIFPGDPTTSPTAAPTTTPAVQGDPHFKTWTGESYDFHGVCDLVLLSNNKFENGLGIDIHTRTTKMRMWSYVSVAAIRIGEDILEVVGGEKEKNFWLNGVLGEEVTSNTSEKNTAIASISSYPIYFHKESKKQQTFKIDLGEEEEIVIGTWHSFIRIQFNNAKSKHFEGSVGLMGSFSKGIRLARDNVTVLEDFNVFGQEWQVLQSEKKLFRTVKGPQHPVKCSIPSSFDMRRRLEESQITLSDAKKACADVQKDVIDLCVFDIMATNDKKVVGAY